MAKTIQLGLRISTDLLEKIEKMAKHESIDKMSWIRRALATFVKGEEIEAKSEAIEDYINLRIDESKLKKIASFDKIPRDIQDSRKEMLTQIKEGVRLK